MSQGPITPVSILELAEAAYGLGAPSLARELHRVAEAFAEVEGAKLIKPARPDPRADALAAAKAVRFALQSCCEELAYVIDRAEKEEGFFLLDLRDATYAAKQEAKRIGGAS